MRAETLEEALLIIEEQVKTIEQLKKKIAELEGTSKNKEVPSFVKKNIRRRRKKNGQKKGHKGYSRPSPEHIDEVVEHDIEKCPICKEHDLSDVQEERERCITDIPEQRKARTIKYKIKRRYCRRCKKIVEKPIIDALPHAQFGLRLMLFILILKIGMRLPVEKIRELLANQYDLNISGGEIMNILNQLANFFGPYYNELKQKIREAKIRFIDETGRRVNGKNCYLWGFVTKEIAYFVIRRSRGHKVPLRVLGKRCKGLNTNDRFSAYYVLVTKTKCIMQLCWCHMLRESKKLARDFPEGKIVHKRLKRIFKDACAFNGKGTKQDVEKLLARLDAVRKMQFHSSMCYRFIKNLTKRDRDYLFHFVTNPDVEPTSNRIERGLRHDVIIRKISGGNRSKHGANVHEILLSVVQTYRLQNKNLQTEGLDYLKQQLQMAK